MALSEAVRNSFLNSLCRAATTSYAAVYVQLHVGDPGLAGTSNQAGESTRQAATFGSVAQGGAISNTADIAWVSVSTTETLSHISLWTASSLGTYLGSAALTQSKSVNSGDNFSLPTGDLDLTIS